LNSCSQKFADYSRASKCLILLSLLLVVISATAQAIHFHPAPPTNEIKNCALCQLAATTALAILIIALPILRRQITFAYCSDQAQTGSVFAFFNLFSRPPPAA
jgi:hypothetical protein